MRTYSPSPGLRDSAWSKARHLFARRNLHRHWKSETTISIRSKVRYRCSAIGFGTTLSEGSISLV
jgi:hypothetical protein